MHWVWCTCRFQSLKQDMSFSSWIRHCEVTILLHHAFRGMLEVTGWAHPTLPLSSFLEVHTIPCMHILSYSIKEIYIQRLGSSHRDQLWYSRSCLGQLLLPGCISVASHLKSIDVKLECELSTCTLLWCHTSQYIFRCLKSFPSPRDLGVSSQMIFRFEFHGARWRLLGWSVFPLITRTSRIWRHTVLPWVKLHCTP